MIVTSIEPVDKKKSRIYIDDRKAFVLYNGEIRKMNLIASENISDETYEYIISEILKKRARSRAMHILERQDRARRQLIEMLKRNEYPIDVIDDAVEYVESYHYIDDMRYAIQFIRCGCHKKSKRQLISALQRRGIDKEVVEAAFVELSSEINIAKEQVELIQKIIRKRLPDPDNITENDIQRTYRYLISKGFKYEDIRSVSMYGDLL